MKYNIQVIEAAIDDGYEIILRIYDVLNEEEALTAAEEWCDENNSLIIGRPLADEQYNRPGKLVFNVKVCSDDYSLDVVSSLALRYKRDILN